MTIERKNNKISFNSGERILNILQTSLKIKFCLIIIKFLIFKITCSVFFLRFLGFQAPTPFQTLGLDVKVKCALAEKGEKVWKPEQTCKKNRETKNIQINEQTCEMKR